MRCTANTELMKFQLFCGTEFRDIKISLNGYLHCFPSLKELHKPLPDCIYNDISRWYSYSMS